jgi:hypothetical protein
MVVNENFAIKCSKNLNRTKLLLSRDIARRKTGGLGNEAKNK